MRKHGAVATATVLLAESEDRYSTVNCKKNLRPVVWLSYYPSLKLLPFAKARSNVTELTLNLSNLVATNLLRTSIQLKYPQFWNDPRLEKAVRINSEWSTRWKIRPRNFLYRRPIANHELRTVRTRYAHHYVRFIISLTLRPFRPFLYCSANLGLPPPRSRYLGPARWYREIEPKFGGWSSSWQVAQ